MSVAFSLPKCRPSAAKAAGVARPARSSIVVAGAHAPGVAGLVSIKPWSRSRQGVVVHAEKDGDFDPNVFYGEMSFGKPAAPKEIWQRYKNEAREAFMAEMAKEEAATDCLVACLNIAAEDDAVHTAAIVPLPIEPYVKRVNKMADELAAYHLPAKGSSQEEVLEAIEVFIFETSSYKLAVGPLEEYSTYRMYMHNVVAQKMGTKVALGVLLQAVVARLSATGAIDFEPAVVLPADLRIPFLAPGGGVKREGRVGEVMSSKALVLRLLDSLKRSYWAWEWDVRAESGFMNAALAAVGATGRVGTANSTTGVIQASGRPFGDLTRSLLQAERLAIAGGPAFNYRDAGVLLYHLARPTEAYEAMTMYMQEVGGAPPLGSGAPAVPAIAGLGMSPAEERERELAGHFMDKLSLMVSEAALGLKE